MDDLLASGYAGTDPAAQAVHPPPLRDAAAMVNNHSSEDRLLEILQYLDEVEKDTTIEVVDQCSPSDRLSPLTMGDPAAATGRDERAPPGSPKDKDEEEERGRADITQETAAAPVRPASSKVEGATSFKPSSIDCEGEKENQQQRGKWVWDELEEQEEEKNPEAACSLDISGVWPTKSGLALSGDKDERLGKAASLSGGSQELLGKPPLSELTALGQDVMVKIRAMKGELQARSEEAEELEEALQRRKAAYERARKNAEQVWRTDLRRAKKEHERAMQEQSLLAEQLQDDLTALNKRCGDLNRQVQQVRDGRVHEIRDAKSACTAELQRAKDGWVAGERARLQRLASTKAEEIKAQTIKALEPELHRLITKNRQEIKQAKVDGQKRLAGLKLALEIDLEKAVLEAGKKQEGEMAKELEGVKAQQESKMAELVQRHEQEVTDMREEGRRVMEIERVRFETERRRFMEVHTEEIESVTREMRGRVKAAMEAQDRELVALSVEHSRAMEEAKRALLLDTEQGRKEVVNKLQAGLHVHKEGALANIRRQHAGELEAVLTRLKKEQRVEHAALEARQEEELQKLRRELDEELDRVRRRRAVAVEKADRASAAAVEEEAVVAKHESEIEEIEQRLGQVGVEVLRLKRCRETGKGEGVSRLSDLSSTLKTTLRHNQERREAMQEEVRSWTIKVAEANGAISVAAADHQHDKNAELVRVQDKVDQIYRRKQELLTSLQSQLSSLQALNKDKEVELERQRRLVYAP